MGCSINFKHILYYMHQLEALGLSLICSYHCIIGYLAHEASWLCECKCICTFIWQLCLYVSKGVIGML